MIKKIIFCLVLLPFTVFGQSYPNINQSMSLNDWFYGGVTGGGSGSITISNNVLTVSFSGSWNAQQMKTGIIMPINVTPSLPNMELGAIKSNANPSLNTGYYVKIENNNLVFHTFGQSSPYITGCTFSYSGYIQCTTSILWYRDADGDGYGTQAQSTVGCPTNCAQVYACTQPNGYVSNASDYNDTTVNITNIAPQTFYQDADGDTLGNPGISVYYSVKPVGYVTNSSDCDDTNASILSYVHWHPDADGDGFGNGAITSTSGCTPSNAGWISDGRDCDDTNAAINPNTIWYRDADGDGFGTSETTIGCTQPIGYVSNSTDCNDVLASINPNTVWYRDADGDDLGDIQIFIISCLQPVGYVSNSNDTNDNPFCNYCASFDLVKGEKYLVSGWLQESDPALPQTQFKNFSKGSIGISFKDIDGVIIDTQQKYHATGEIIDGWQRIIGEFVVPPAVVEMNLELINENMDQNTIAYFDDIRVLPSKGNMKSFVYDQKTQRLMAELDENNYSTFYEYDIEGGLVRVKKETEKGVFTIQETRSGNAKTDKP